MRPHDKSIDTALHSADKQPRTAPTKRVVLTRDQAARWLILLSQFASWDSTTSPAMIKLRDQLENESWLARWKRESVTVDFCPTLIAEVTGTR